MASLSGKPSLVARHKKTGRILAVGSEAKQMEGRTPDFLETLHPLRDGVIADFDVTAAMLRIFLKKALRGRKFVQPTLVVSVPCGVTAVERRAVIDAATQAGARDAYLIEEPLAAALGADMPVREAAGNMVVDLGGGSTELVLGGDGIDAPSTQVQAAFSMDIGSVRMTERHLRHDPPSETEIAEAIADIDEHIDEAFRTVPAGRTRTIIGVSGTVTTMSALALGLKEYDHRRVDGVRIPVDDAYAVDDRFLRMTREQRRAYKTIHPGRIDVVGGGAVVWNRVLAKVAQAAAADHGGVIDSYVASEHGLLDGIVLDCGRRLLAER